MSRLEGHRLFIVTAVQLSLIVQVTHYFLRDDLLLVLQIKVHRGTDWFITLNRASAVCSDSNPQPHMISGE